MTPEDWKRAESGVIPWTADEYFAVFEERVRLAKTPHDDWDRTPKRFSFEGRRYRINTDMHENQLMSFMAARYRELDMAESMSHMNRYFIINGFLSDHLQHLITDGIIKGHVENDEVQLPEALIEVLAVSAYDATTLNAGGHTVPTFDYDRVVAETRELIAREDSDEGHDESAP